MNPPPNYPVIVIHLADERHPEWTACGAEMPLEAEPSHNHVPRYLCQACATETIEAAVDTEET